MIEFFYDCSSPWTFLGFDSMQRLAAELHIEVDWRPILVGAVFNEVNDTVYRQRASPVAAKQKYMQKDLGDWAALQQIPIIFPPTVFPVNSAQAMRLCLAARGSGRIEALSRRVFEAYWCEDRDISCNEVLKALVSEVDLDAEEMIATASTAEFREMLRQNTSELIARGGFGSPTIFVGGDEMFFGNDRMPVVRQSVQRLTQSRGNKTV